MVKYRNSSVSWAHILPFSPQRDTVSSTFVALSFSFACRQTPFKTRWLIIYPGNEMPKPGETHHQDRKGHSHPAQRYTLLDTRSHTQQWWMAITSLSVLQADRVFILVSKHRRDQGQSKNLTDEVKSSREPWKKPSFKNHSHVRGGELADQ